MPRDSISKVARREVIERSDAMCEAMRRNRKGIYARCWFYPVDIHHMLTKGRGGDVLDAVGETYHLIALCRSCHQASDGATAYAGGLLIEGYVNWNPTRTKPVYIGPDLYLSSKYPNKVKERV